MNVLFIGCGDIGGRVISQCSLGSAAGENQFIAMRRHVANLPTMLTDKAGVTALEGDIKNTQQLVSIFDDHASGPIDAVVVTLTPGGMSDAHYRDSYVAGAASLLAAVKRASSPPQLVLWVSSSGVYGQSEGEWVDENSPTVPSNYRGKRLLEAESLIRQLPVAHSILRFSGVYGPGRERLKNRVLAGDIAPASPLQWSNRIHADDGAGAIRHLLQQYLIMEAEIQPTYLISDNQPTPIHEVHCWLADYLGVNLVDGTFTVSTSDSARESGVVANRRCNNQRLLDSGFSLQYPSYKEGFSATFESANS